MGELVNLLDKLKRDQPLAFDNADYGVRITHTEDTDMRIMSFVDVLWEFEVTGGKDQFEPLTIVSVCKQKDPRLRKDGRAMDGGMRVNDVILQINDTPADDLTLMEACEMIRESGRHLRIYVKGEGYTDPETTDYTVSLWYKLPPKSQAWKWEGAFPWNDKGCKILRESNCFQVPSKIANKFKDKFEKTAPATDRFFPQTKVNSIWNRKWQAKESDCIVESFETVHLKLPKARTPAA